MISDKYLSDVIIEKVKTNIKLDGVKLVKGEYSNQSLIPLINVAARNRCIVEIYKQQAGIRLIRLTVALHKRKSTLVFAANVEHVRNLVDSFRNQGIDARGILGTTASCQRSQLIQDFKAGVYPVLINCGNYPLFKCAAILTEGTDIPPVDCILLARPTRSAVLLQQMLGRGLRLSEGKEYCLVLDFEDCINQRLVKANVPSLFGLNNNFDTNGKFLYLIKGERVSCIINRLKLIEQNSHISSGTILGAMSRQDLESILQGAINGTSFQLNRFDNPFSSNSLESENRWMSSYSELSWVRVRAQMWALNLTGTEETLMIQKNNGHYDCLSRVKYSSTKRVFTHDTLESAFNAANTFIVKRFGYMSSLKFHMSADWRKLPITDIQKTLLKKWNIEIWNGMKRGQASDLLLKRQLGAMQESRIFEKQEKQIIKAKFH